MRGLLSLTLKTLLLCSLTLTWCSPVSADEENTLDQFAARAAAEYFLILVDQGEYEKCWSEASSFFREATVKSQWEKRIGHLRDQNGVLIDRQLRFHKFLENVEGAPPGEYFYMIFGTSFINQDSAIESVTVMKEPDGRWRVSGYSIE